MNKRVNSIDTVMRTLGHLEFLKTEIFEGNKARQAWVDIMINDLVIVLNYLRVG